MGLRDYSLYDFLQHNARMTGNDPAMIAGDRTVTHQEFLDRVDRLAAGFVAVGLTRGDRICILAQNSLEYFDIYGACAKTGTVAYPVNWRLSPAEVAGVLKLAAPKMLLVGLGHLPQLEGADTNTIPIRAIIGPGDADGFTSLTDFYQTPAGEPYDPQRDAPFVILSTAAVEGVPRGAVLTNENLFFAGQMLISRLGLTKADRHLAALPLFHVTGLGLSLAAMQVGGVNVVTERFDPVEASSLIDKHQVTFLATFPPIMSMLLEARKATGATWENLKHVIGLDTPEVIQQIFTTTQAKFWTGFGQSETAGVVTLTRIDEKPGATGKPLPGIRVRLVNEQGQDVPMGEPGEIAVQGPVVFTGFWRDPDATRFTFRHGWHHTGDLGKLDAEGYLYYAGRKPEKDLIKPGGENVYPAEVEHAILELDEVAAVCVIGVPDEKWGEAVKAVIELTPGATLTTEQVVDAVAARIASYKKPRYVDFVDSLPRLSSGEINRIAVKENYG